MITQTITLNVLAYQEGENWVAQGIEVDIYARAASLPRLPEAFALSLTKNVCINEEIGRTGLDGIPAAPTKFQDAFRRSSLQLKDGFDQHMAAKAYSIGEVKVAEAV